MPRRRVLVGMASYALAQTGVGATAAQTPTIPAGPVKLIVPFAAGGSTDAVARIYAKSLGDLTGNPVIVENRVGANGVIGVQAFLRSPPDGSTLLIGSSSTLATNVALLKEIPYDPLKDLFPIATLLVSPYVLVVRPESPARTLMDLVRASANGKGLNYGSGATTAQVLTDWMNELAAIRATHIPYKGSGEVVAALLAGTVDYAVMELNVARALIQSERLRALLISSSQRDVMFKNVPTPGEAGIPDFVTEGWVAAALPAAAPAGVRNYWQAMFARAGASSTIRTWFMEQHLKSEERSSDQMRALQAGEIAQWRTLMRRLRIEQQ